MFIPLARGETHDEITAGYLYTGDLLLLLHHELTLLRPELLQAGVGHHPAVEYLLPVHPPSRGHLELLGLASSQAQLDHGLLEVAVVGVIGRHLDHVHEAVPGDGGGAGQLPVARSGLDQ